jgi:DNA-binding NtrC family response regulator
VLTANDSPAMARQVMAAGAFVVRTKPFDLDDLEALVARAIATNHR